jgi:hypothetical protein
MLTEEKRHELENILAFRNAKRHALRIAKQYTHFCFSFFRKGVHITEIRALVEVSDIYCIS